MAITTKAQRMQILENKLRKLVQVEIAKKKLNENDDRNYPKEILEAYNQLLSCINNLYKLCAANGLNADKQFFRELKYKAVESPLYDHI